MNKKIKVYIFVCSLFIFILPLNNAFASVETDILTLTNQERINNGVSALTWNYLLAQAAQFRAQDMIDNDYFAHYRPDGTPWYQAIEDTGYIYIYAGENIAMGYTTAPSVVAAWMASPGHRANILDDSFEELGVGLATGDYKGYQTTIMVQLFAAPHPSSPPATLPESKPGGPYIANEGVPVSFNASNSVLQNTINEYKWDWDDDGTYDSTTSSPTISHTFNDGPLVQTVKLQVKDIFNNTDEATTTVTINNVAPEANAGPSQVAKIGESFSISGSATDTSPDTAAGFTYEWDFDWNGIPGNFTIDSTGANQTHTYNSYGIFTVGLRVRDKDGGEGYASTSIVVLDPKSYLPNITKNYASWTTPFVIQNLGTEDATIHARFTDSGGALKGTMSFYDIKPGNSCSVNPSSLSTLGSSFKGSVIVYSTQEMASIVNEHSSKTLMAYEGIDPDNASTKTYLPNITRNYYGWTTPFIIQNLDSTEATINIRYFRKGEAVPTLEETVTVVSPGSSISDNPLSKTSLGTFQGSVVVESTGKVGAVVNEHYGTTQAMSYNGFSAGSNTIYLPNITRDYYGWTTPFIIQNIGTEEVTVTASFYPKGSSFSSYDETITGLAPGSNTSINPAKVSSLGTFQGSVVVQANSGEIVAVVNEHSSTDSMAYSSIQSGETTNYLPNITKNYYGWTTPLAIQNLDLASALVDIDFYDSSGTKIHTISGQSIQPGSTFSLNPAGQSALGSIFKGSVVVTCTNGQNITSIVNEHKTNGQAMSYNGF